MPQIENSLYAADWMKSGVICRRLKMGRRGGICRRLEMARERKSGVERRMEKEGFSINGIRTDCGGQAEGTRGRIAELTTWVGLGGLID